MILPRPVTEQDMLNAVRRLGGRAGLDPGGPPADVGFGPTTELAVLHDRLRQIGLTVPISDAAAERLEKKKRIVERHIRELERKL